MADIEILTARRQLRRVQRRAPAMFNTRTMQHHNQSTKSSRANGVTMPNLDRYNVRAIPFMVDKVHPPACRASKYMDPYSVRGCCSKLVGFAKSANFALIFCAVADPGMKSPFKDERPRSAKKLLDIENEVNIATQQQV
jgi:hypothetical protein